MKYRHTMIVMCISLPICVLLRALQLIFTIDSGTGFIKQQYASISTLITLIICVTALAVGMLAALTDGIEKNEKNNRPKVSVSSVLLGGMFVYHTVTLIFNLENSAWYDVLLVLLSLSSAFVFLLYGLKNIYDYHMPLFSLIAPVLYFIIKLISVFISTSTLALVTENIFLIFTNCMLLWFMFEFASFENEIGDTNNKPTRLFASGLSAITLCAVNSIPKIIQIAYSKTQIARGDVAAMLLNISLAVFICAYVIDNFVDAQRRTKSAPKHLA